MSTAFLIVLNLLFQIFVTTQTDIHNFQEKINLFSSDDSSEKQLVFDVEENVSQNTSFSFENDLEEDDEVFEDELFSKNAHLSIVCQQVVEKNLLLHKCFNRPNIPLWLYVRHILI